MARWRARPDPRQFQKIRPAISRRRGRQPGQYSDRTEPDPAVSQRRAQHARLSWRKERRLFQGPAGGDAGFKRWSQFDGSIGDPVIRSMIAVFTSGTTRTALNDPQIADNIVKAANYTLRLGIDPP